MTAPEVPDYPVEEERSVEEQRRLDRLMVNAGFSGSVAMAAVTGRDTEITVAIPERPPRYSHRGGRSYPEDDTDEFWNPPYKKLDEAEEARRKADQQGPGHREAAFQAHLAATSSLVRKADGDVKRLLALQRAHADKQVRKK